MREDCLLVTRRYGKNSIFNCIRTVCFLGKRGGGAGGGGESVTALRRAHNLALNFDP